jgi:type III secretion protein C
MRQLLHFLGIGSILLSATPLIGQPSNNAQGTVNTNSTPSAIQSALDNSTLDAKQSPPNSPQVDGNGYVINFNNVSIIEYIRFISQISNTNFVFQESDLQFNVTIISEGATSVEDIMSALLQILQIHGLTLVEQGNNVLIYKTQDATKLASVVEGNSNAYAPLVTRVIRTLYANPQKLKSIIAPMLSQQAVVEVSPETRHIIVTDINGNIEKVLDLIKYLDVPNTSIDVVTYFPQNGSADSLLLIADKILQPIALAEGTTISLVQQPSTNTIFITANPDMVQRAMNVLEALDQPGTGLDMPNTSVEVATYAAVNMPAASLIALAERILLPIATTEDIPFNLVLQPSTQLIFITSTPTFNKRALEVLGILDQPGGSPTQIIADLPQTDIDRINFFVYKLQHQSGERIHSALQTIGQSLNITGISNLDLVNALNDITWLPDTNSLLFLGTDNAIAKISKILREIDVPSRQVYIEVLMLKTSIQNSLNFGVQWAARVQNANGFKFNTGSIGYNNPLSPGSNLFPNPFQVPPTIGTPSAPPLPLYPGFDIGSIGDFLTHNGKWFGSIGALLNAVQGEVDTKIIMNPKIIAEDNRQAQVFVGYNIPFTTTNVNITAANSSTGFTVDYRDVGVLLEVTPTLGLGDMVTLEIHQEINEIFNTQRVDGYPLPETEKILTTTRVHVPSGYFLVISGLVKNKKQYARSGIPCLGCLPVIGGAFSDQGQLYEKDNVIIFLQPRIIDTPCQMGWISEHEGRDHYCNSTPEPCDPDCQTNRFYHDYSPGPTRFQCR